MFRLNAVFNVDFCHILTFTNLRNPNKITKNVHHRWTTEHHSSPCPSKSQVNIIRNVLPIVTFVLEKILFNSPRLVRPGHILSMVLTLFGTTLYGISNFSVTTWSLVMILLGTWELGTGWYFNFPVKLWNYDGSIFIQTRSLGTRVSM